MLRVFDIRAPLPRPGLSPVCVCMHACTLAELGRCVCWSAGLSACRSLYLMFPVTQLEAALASQAGGSIRPLRPGLWACRFPRASEDADVPPHSLSASRFLLTQEGQQ